MCDAIHSAFCCEHFFFSCSSQAFYFDHVRRRNEIAADRVLLVLFAMFADAVAFAVGVFCFVFFCFLWQALFRLGQTKSWLIVCLLLLLRMRLLLLSFWAFMCECLFVLWQPLLRLRRGNEFVADGAVANAC